MGERNGGRGRRAGAAGALAVLLVVALAAAFPAPPGAVSQIPRVPPSGEVVLARDEQALTDWVEVPAGLQARWSWDAHAYINFEVEARGIGLLDGGDTGAGHGCVRGEPPFAIRIWWGHTAWPSQAEPARVNYSIVVEAADPFYCENVTTVHQTRGAQLSGGPLDEVPPWWASAWPVLFPVLVGNLAYAAVLPALFWPAGEPNPAAPKRRP